MEVCTHFTADHGSIANWPELKRVIEENRCELVITNQRLDKREPSINEEKLQNTIFQIQSPINFVDLSQVNLTILYPSISRLTHLSSLVLRSNRLKEIPEEIGVLENLKVLDLSYNEIESLPQTCNQLKRLSSLNLSNNKINKLPDLSGLSCLQMIDLSYNALSDFPTALPAEDSRLQTLLLNNNNIKRVPDSVKENAKHLKTLDLSENDICDLPLPLGFLPKLKMLNLASNSFNDKRFGKLAEDKRHAAPSIVDYLKKKALSSTKPRSRDVFSETPSSRKHDNDSPSLIIRFGSGQTSVTRIDAVVELRPHIACCMLRNISFDTEKLKLFFSIQNKLHDTLCAHRTLATIGTHDRDKLSFPLKYTALDPDVLKITPLNKKVLTTGRDLIGALTAEAEQLRKKQKRNSFSSIHKYLYLVEKLPKYPCILDADDNVLSFAPVTNSETTKISIETREIFVEITSSENQMICRTVMDRLIEELVNNNFCPVLIVEQIKVMQQNGNLLIAYPGKLDLQLPSINIIRETMNGNDS